MNMDQALQTYIAESRTLLEEMEQALLRLESEPSDADTVNAMFRAAHTIKGSAGLFGLDAIVAFTHVVENLLDKLRDGELTADGDLISLLLECRDHISALIDVVADGDALDADQVANGEQLLAQLHQRLGTGSELSQMPAATDRLQTSAGGQMESDCWHIALEFGPEVLRNGMDPMSFIRYLSTLGDIVNLITKTDRMPPLALMDPEACYLSFQIELKSEAEKSVIESAFEFVRDDCAIRILPPPSHFAKYLERIQNLSGNVDKLGEILLEAGVLSSSELKTALAVQKAAENEVPTAVPLGEILVQQGMTPKVAVDAALEKQKQVRDHKAQEAKFVRVQAEKLDQFINLVGELVIAGASTTLLAQRSGNATLTESASVMSRLVEEIRDGALRLRMVEIGETFNRFQRVVRDVSKELGKDIVLEISGAETELDKTVVEKIGDPLMHLVRNAMDHGIERQDARLVAGKSAQGTLRLHAYHESGSIVIEVSDDGGGLKRDKILAKAIERGLVAPGQQLTDQEVYNLIFEPGFSTADAVTNLSGRGVGMDVVKRNIQSLRGMVEVMSDEGAGTTVRIRLPLTLAIIDGFLVGVGKSAFVVPLDMVLECVELSEADRTTRHDRNYINLRGEVLPYICLRDQFQAGTTQSRRENIVVVQYAGKKAGLVVDELMGEFQTVIKPLGRLFTNIQGISGSTILGTGEVALILDVPSLVQFAADREALEMAR